MKKGIISLGEALIDFIPLDKHNQDYTKQTGGAPANVAVGIAKLGSKVAFIGKVGDDFLGNDLKNTLNHYGVNTEAMYMTKEVNTGITFVSLDSHGERTFNFYINPSADYFLTAEEIPNQLFKEHSIFHFGSISLISEPAKSATKRAVQLAKEKDMYVSFDPNYRAMLWDSEENAKETIIDMFSHTDILKISDEELTLVTGEIDISKGIEKFKQFHIPLVFVTLGAKGTKIIFKEGSLLVEATKIKAIDTTGAGDAFVSSVLHQISTKDKPIQDYTMEELIEITSIANISGALTVSTKGAMTALPTQEKLKNYLTNKQI